jgi:hypothetical protein
MKRPRRPSPSGSQPSWTDSLDRVCHPIWARISFSLPIFAFRFSCGTLFCYRSTTYGPLSVRASGMWLQGGQEGARQLLRNAWLAELLNRAPGITKTFPPAMGHVALAGQQAAAPRLIGSREVDLGGGMFRMAMDQVGRRKLRRRAPTPFWHHGKFVDGNRQPDAQRDTAAASVDLAKVMIVDR